MNKTAFLLMGVLLVTFRATVMCYEHLSKNQFMVMNNCDGQATGVGSHPPCPPHIPTAGLNPQAGPTGPNTSNAPKFGHTHVFATLVDEEMPTKFPLSLQRETKLLSATYEIVSPTGKVVFEAKLSIRRNRSTTPTLELHDKDLIREATKYLEKGNAVVVVFETEKEIKHGDMKVLAGSAKAKL
ncbi:MAG TPA: hypothetical protein VG649_11870 [Candidatus Angelobacter sp.]|jgi:hypothetical protein|nr:hypothetical protein [Candidatus Angelobacter sp.]